MAPAERYLIDALVLTSFRTMAVLSRVAAEHELSLTQLRVLGILRDRRLKMGELAGYLGLDRSTVSGLVDRAEARGLVRRAPSPGDGRVVEVFLSRAGKNLAERGTGQVAESLLALIGPLSGAQRHRLQELLLEMLGAA